MRLLSLDKKLEFNSKTATKPLASLSSLTVSYRLGFQSFYRNF